MIDFLINYLACGMIALIVAALASVVFGADDDTVDPYKVLTLVLAWPAYAGLCAIWIVGLVCAGIVQLYLNIREKFTR